jgi:hypothetical protein
MVNNPKYPVSFCIPDLTGFTKFMTTADSDFAHQVISKILNKLIATNILDMKVAEVEGDAIFFYRTGRLPAISKVAKQCKLLFQAFNNVVDSYAQTEPENFQKYLAKNQLGLKIIIHHGETTITKINGKIKLLGEDVILAHKLLKNSVPFPCYIMLTNNYIDKIKNKKIVRNWFNWERLKNGKDKYEHFGLTHYSYIPLPDCNINEIRK